MHVLDERTASLCVIHCLYVRYGNMIKLLLLYGISPQCVVAAKFSSKVMNSSTDLNMYSTRSSV